ncbi:hypothetical protein EJ04DRAFT_455366 [Polyplosphaeria fusca]|uniref:TUG ubiquitin-like domain-containing protein n=1 Tax=Polyplosphaeria fusca TaxID=682080 RepID=A0A9P4RC60_9PLEO|nr:hypothetical protein EJ04DRAFT_455366 [Polyplosphaeria fusca]
MSHVTVYNSAARSHKISTTPGKYLTEVRDEACQKFNLSPAQFTLKYNNKPISLSQQIRLANLPQGARLELIQASRSPTVISVALQLPATEKPLRLTEKFASNTTLWGILRHFEEAQGSNYNFTQRAVPHMGTDGSTGAGRLNYEMPAITVMPAHKEYSSFMGLQHTLIQLGFDSGSALLKLGFKNSGQPLEEAMAEITQYFKSFETPADGAHSAATAQLKSTPNPERAAPEASEVVAGSSMKQEQSEPGSPMEVDSEPAFVDGKATSGAEAMADQNVVASSQTENTPPSKPESAPLPNQTSVPPPSSPGFTRNVQIFAAPTSSTPQAARNAFNEADYVPTIEHAKSHQASLEQRTRNKRLQSDKEMEAEEAGRQEKLKAAADKGATLRIRLADQTIIQLNITKADTGHTLYDFVSGYLEHTEPFQLKYVGNRGQQVLVPRSDARLIQDLYFSPKETITFIWDEAASAAARTSRKTLAQQFQSQAQKLEVKDPVFEYKPDSVQPTKTEAKKKTSSGDKESKLKSLLNKGLFKR